MSTVLNKYIETVAEIKQLREIIAQLDKTVSDQAERIAKLDQDVKENNEVISRIQSDRISKKRTIDQLQDESSLYYGKYLSKKLKNAANKEKVKAWKHTN